MRKLQILACLLLLTLPAFSQPMPEWKPQPSVKLGARIDISGAWSLCPPPQAQMVDVSQKGVIVYQWFRSDLYRVSVEIDTLKNWPFLGKTREYQRMMSGIEMNAKSNPKEFPALKLFTKREWGKVSGCDALRMTGTYPSGKFFCGELWVWGKTTRVRATWIAEGKKARDECESVFASIQLRKRRPPGH